MRELVDDVFLGAFSGPAFSGQASSNPGVDALEDQARLLVPALAEPGARLAFTTDSFVVHPLFFPGGDIGKLAVCGTVNDLAVGGARPLALSCSVILEEGFPVAELRRICASMAAAAEAAGVEIVTGDTKVVTRGAADGLFVNTAGIGVIPPGRDLGAHAIAPGDRILVNGTVGEHGAAVMAARDDLGLETTLESDCRALNHLVEAMLSSAPGVRAIRDATRGGVAAVLNEFAGAAKACCVIDDERLPLRQETRGIAEILGLDPLHLANEGLLVAVVDAADVEPALAALRATPGGESAAEIGAVREAPAGALVAISPFGGERLVDMLDGDQLPRIC